MLVTRKSIINQKVYSLEMNIAKSDLELYEQNKVLVQDLFPHLSKGEREFIISGITPEQWKVIFGKHSN